MRIWKEKIAKISKDFILSITASIIYTFVRQIVVFPVLAVRLPETDYGTLLTVVGLVNVVNAMVGGSLNNIRLVQNEYYEEKTNKGDFLLLCTLGSGLSLICVFFLGGIFHLSWVTTILLGLYSCTNNYYQYSTAHFRLSLDFKRNLYVNCLVSVATIPMTFVFASATFWPIIFLAGDIVGLIYNARTTHFYKETLKKTDLFKETTQKVFALALVNILANLLMYADRFIIYPLLGSESVSYYSTASFFGKSAGIVMTPIAGVLLGYFSKKGFQASKRLFVILNGLSGVCLILFMIGCYLFAPWFTKLLYPTLYEQSAPYIMWANLGAVIAIAGNMAQPMILKFCKIKTLIAIQAVYGVSYILLSLWLLPLWGLFGFCVATVAANTIRLLALYITGLLLL